MLQLQYLQRGTILTLSHGVDNAVQHVHVGTSRACATSQFYEYTTGLTIDTIRTLSS
jgi:hypothetical protein